MMKVYAVIKKYERNETDQEKIIDVVSSEESAKALVNECHSRDNNSHTTYEWKEYNVEG